MTISTGSNQLDEFIGKYNNDEFTLIYGKPGTGKTTLGMLVTLSQTKNNKKVIYIDAENGFSLDRLKQLSENAEELLNNIIIFKPKSFDEQHKQIINLPKTKVSLIIVDTIGIYYRKQLKEDYRLANDMVVEQLRKLKEFTKENIPVIIINQVYSNMEENGINPVGGDLIKNHCKKIIRLDHNIKREIILEVPERKRAIFEIIKEGIKL